MSVQILFSKLLCSRVEVFGREGMKEKKGVKSTVKKRRQTTIKQQQQQQRSLVDLNIPFFNPSTVYL